MTIHTLHLTTRVAPTFRTHQVAGLFDLALDELAGERFAHTLTAELPGVDEDWTIGAIVGPSGSGKTTLARAAYGDAVYEPGPWPEDVALIDALEMRNAECGVRNDAENLPSTPHSELRIPNLKDLLRTLTAVGLASPPSWLRPYHVLSTGERFRAELARAILQLRIADFGLRIEQADSSSSPQSAICNPQSLLLVFDEFTSTLDRTVACTASFALARFLRRHQDSEVRVQGSGGMPDLNPEPRTLNPLRFVALSCHTDFLPWLAPDWVLDLSGDATSPADKTARRRDRETERPRARNNSLSLRLSVSPSLRPHWHCHEAPALPLTIRRVPQSAWPRFARHHYLSGGLSTAATCYGAFLDEGSGFRVQGSGAEHLTSVLNPEPRTLNPLPIAFCAVLATLGHRRTKHISRLVVLPEYQGLGIGPRLAEEVAAIEAAKGFRVTITASHPAVLAWCAGSPRWRYLGLKKTGSTRQRLGPRAIRSSTGRAVASFEFVAEKVV